MCTVNLIVRKLETSVMKITPNIIAMESETELTQYLITNWTLTYNNSQMRWTAWRAWLNRWRP